MRKRLTLIDGSLAVILPPELLEHYGISEEVELEAGAEGLVLRPVTAGLSFEDAVEKVFAEQDELLRRLAQSNGDLAQAQYPGVGDIWQLMEALFAELGHEDAGDLIADEVHAGRLTVLQAADALNCGIWAGRTNGTDLKPTLDRWLRDGSDVVRVEIALRQDVYSLDAGPEMRKILLGIAQNWPQLADRCYFLLSGIKTSG